MLSKDTKKLTLPKKISKPAKVPEKCKPEEPKEKCLPDQASETAKLIASGLKPENLKKCEVKIPECPNPDDIDIEKLKKECFTLSCNASDNAWCKNPNVEVDPTACETVC